MSSFIHYHANESVLGDVYTATASQPLITLNQGVVSQVITSGETRLGGFFKDYDQIASIYLGPHSFTFENIAEVKSKESIVLDSKVTATCRIKGDIDSIGMVVASEAECMSVLRSQLYSALRTVVLTASLDELTTNIPELERACLNELRPLCIQLPFDVLTVHLDRLTPKDPSIARHLEEAKIAAINAKASEFARQQEAADNRFRRNERRLEEANRLRLERARGRNEFWLKKKEHDLDEQKLNNAQRRRFDEWREKARLILQVGGLWATDPILAKEVEIAKLKAQSAQERLALESLLRIIRAESDSARAAAIGEARGAMKTWGSLLGIPDLGSRPRDGQQERLQTDENNLESSSFSDDEQGADFEPTESSNSLEDE